MTAFIDIGSTTPMLATMIGLAVGIDYALFILARYRSELQHTDDREEAVGHRGRHGRLRRRLRRPHRPHRARPPWRSSGSRSWPAWASPPPPRCFIAVLVALTLLPALLGLTKSKAFGGRVRRYRAEAGRRRPGPQQRRPLGTHVGRAPVAVVLVVVIGLGALALPLQGLHLAFPTDSTASVDTTQRKASDLVADAFGPGREAPMLSVVDARDVPRDRPRRRVRRRRGLGRRSGRGRQRPGRGHQRAGHRRPGADHARDRPGGHRDRGPARRRCATGRRRSRRRPARPPASPGSPRSRPTCPSASAAPCRSTSPWSSGWRSSC